MQDFAHQMQWLVDVAYPSAPVVRVALDNLNTHRMASLYETFPAAEARRIVKRLEFHHTPKHASWLNMAEIEFSVLTRACLQGAIPTNPACNEQSTPMKPNATRPGPPSIGASAPRMPEPNCIASIPPIPRLTEHWVGRGIARSRWRRPCGWWAWKGMTGGIRTNSQAGSSSAWRWPGRWPRSRT